MSRGFPILFITATRIGDAVLSSGLIKRLADEIPNDPEPSLYRRCLDGRADVSQAVAGTGGIQTELERLAPVAGTHRRAAGEQVARARDACFLRSVW